MSTVYIICPPLDKFAQPPKDQPNSELTDCPKCKEQMWLSGKKRGTLMFYALLKSDIYLSCYHCFEKYAKENPDIVKQTKMQKV